jgi:hypothetical protein
MIYSMKFSCIILYISLFGYVDYTPLVTGEQYLTSRVLSFLACSSISPPRSVAAIRLLPVYPAGVPEHIRSDNGPEFTAKSIMKEAKILIEQ